MTEAKQKPPTVITQKDIEVVVEEEENGIDDILNRGSTIDWMYATRRLKIPMSAPPEDEPIAYLMFAGWLKRKAETGETSWEPIEKMTMAELQEFLGIDQSEGEDDPKDLHSSPTSDN